ncbi:membrane-associated protein, putative [Bodo saltans]|uniref:Membrane-associated protein, putative n=1 Tax=Bodo saltans TaxID=75058 RepID=A0A0S4JPI4_BODSA|nr:membrane-associated protein, putative [Bodo saltans]|eukprot:CUG92087.1 membrane-associated protein, putative [Bodo saltans]
MARRRRLQLPSIHRKTWYFAFLIAGLGALMITGAELSPSDNFDGIYRVMAFNILLVGMLLINTVDRRREYRTMALSKVRLLAYVFTFTTFWWAIFRQAPLAGGVAGTGCTTEGVAQLYPAGATYAEPYTLFFWESCQNGYSELVNYHGAVAAGKCCVEVPPHTRMNCSSGLGLVPNIAGDAASVLSTEGLELYAECCPRMVGDIIPPGISTMLLSASLGILGNILFNAFKRTPIWSCFRQHIIRRIRHSDCAKKMKHMSKSIAAAVTSCFSILAATFCTCIPNSTSAPSDGDVDAKRSPRSSVQKDHEAAYISDDDHGDVAHDDEDGSANGSARGSHRHPVTYNQTNAFLTYDASSPVMVMSADLPPELQDDDLDQTMPRMNMSQSKIRRSTISNPQTCEYAFDRTVRSMLGVAAISSSPCGTYYAVTALHDDGMRHVGVYDVEQFKEQARPTVHFALPDTLQIKKMVDVAISANGRWLAGIHKGRQGWSLFLADDGTLLQSCELGPEHPNLYGITFGPQPFPTLGLVVCISDGRLKQWTISVVKHNNNDKQDEEMGVTNGNNNNLVIDTSNAGGLFEQTVFEDDDDEELDADIYRSKHLVITPLNTSSRDEDQQLFGGHHGSEAVDGDATNSPKQARQYPRKLPTDIARFTMMGAVCVLTQRQLSAGWDDEDRILITNGMGIDRKATTTNENAAAAGSPEESGVAFHHVSFPTTEVLRVREVVAAPYATLKSLFGNSFSASDGSPLTYPPPEKPAGGGGRGTPAWEAEVCNLAVRDDDGSIYLVTVPTTEVLDESFTEKNLESSNGDRYLTPQRIFKSKFNRFCCMAVSPDGNSVACGLLNGSVEVFRRGCVDVQRDFHNHADAVASVCFIDDMHIAVSGYDGILTVVDVRPGFNDKSELSPGIAYKKMTLFPDGNRLACVSENEEIHVHNVGAMLSQSDDHASVPLAMSSRRSDGTVVVAVFNGVDRVEIREVLIDGSKFPPPHDSHDRVIFSGYLPARSVYLNPPGTILVVLSRDGSIISYSLVTSNRDALHVRALDMSRQLGHRKRGPFHAMESVTLNAEGSVALERQQSMRKNGIAQLTRATTVVTVAVEKRDHSYRLHLFQIELPNQAVNSGHFRKNVVDDDERQRRSGGTVVMNKIDLAEHLFSTDGRQGPANDVPLTAVAFTSDATKLCLWIGADVFVCDVDTTRRTMQVICVLHPSPLLKEEKIFQYSIRLKATGGTLQVDHRHGGRVLRIIEHDQHFYVEEWHHVFKERDPDSVWLVDTQAKYIRFRSHLDVHSSSQTPPPAPTKGPAPPMLPHMIGVRESTPQPVHHAMGIVGRSTPQVQLPNHDMPVSQQRRPFQGTANQLPELADEVDGVPMEVTSAATAAASTTTTTAAHHPPPLMALDPVAIQIPNVEHVQHSLPHLLEVYGYPKSKDPMQHAIRRGMNTLFPLLRTDELAQNSITAMLLPRGEGVITTAMCGTAFWPRESHSGKNMTFEVSKFIVDMFQPSEFLILKALVATVMGLISAISLVATFDKYPMSHWTRFAMFCTSLCNGPIYSSVIDPISALTVHLHLQRSGLFPVAGGARATWQHLYADRNSFHKAYLTVGGGVFLLIMIFWFPGFTAVGPFFGSILIACAIVNIIVRLAINSPLISVSNATANASCHRQFLAWLRHCLLFLLCLIDNININFFLQAIIRFPVNTGVILFSGTPYPFYPYVKSQTVGPDMGMFLNTTYAHDSYNIPEIPYASMSGAAVAHVPFYMVQLSSGSCNAVRFSSTFLQQLDTILLMM